jgi:hypothetical protein
VEFKVLGTQHPALLLRVRLRVLQQVRCRHPAHANGTKPRACSRNFFDASSETVRVTTDAADDVAADDADAAAAAAAAAVNFVSIAEPARR